MGGLTRKPGRFTSWDMTSEKPPTSRDQAAREAKLAQALRANLRRRKATERPEAVAGTAPREES